MIDARKVSKEFLELVDQGIFDKDALIVNLVNWLSEDELKEFVEANEYMFLDDEEEES